MFGFELTLLVQMPYPTQGTVKCSTPRAWKVVICLGYAPGMLKLAFTQKKNALCIVNKPVGSECFFFRGIVLLCEKTGLKQTIFQMQILYDAWIFFVNV